MLLNKPVLYLNINLIPLITQEKLKFKDDFLNVKVKVVKSNIKILKIPLLLLDTIFKIKVQSDLQQLILSVSFRDILDSWDRFGLFCSGWVLLLQHLGNEV